MTEQHTTEQQDQQEPQNVQAEHKFQWLKTTLAAGDIPTLRVMARKALTMFDVKEVLMQWYKAANELSIDPQEHLPTVRRVLTQEGLSKELSTFTQAVASAAKESQPHVETMVAKLFGVLITSPANADVAEDESAEDRAKRLAFVEGQRATREILGAIPFPMPVIEFGHMATNMMREHRGWQLPVTVLWLSEHLKAAPEPDMALGLFFMSYFVLSGQKGLADISACAMEMGLVDVADKAELTAMINVEVKTGGRIHNIYEVELLRGVFLAFGHAITETCDTLPWYLQSVGKWLYRLLPTLRWARDRAKDNMLAAAIASGQSKMEPPSAKLDAPFPKITTTDEDRKRYRLAEGEELCCGVGILRGFKPVEGESNTFVDEGGTQYKGLNAEQLADILAAKAEGKFKPLAPVTDADRTNGVCLY